MKKLMIAATVALTAVFAHAYSITWGTVYAWGDNGTSDTYDAATSVGNYWLVALSDTSTSVGGYAVSTEGKLVYNDGTGYAEVASTADSGSYSAYALSGSTPGVLPADNGKAYALIIHDTVTGTWGASEIATLSGISDDPPKGAEVTFKNYIDVAWENNPEMVASQALVNVPEPTSGLLLLLGVAGLALRRRRA